MKIRILFSTIALFIISFSSFGQITIASDGLNGATSLFTLTNGAYYSGNSAVGDSPASSPFFIEGTDSRGVSNASATLLSNDINTATYTSITATFRLASFSVNSNANGADGGDLVTVEVSPNGGINWYSTSRVIGNTNARWSFTSGVGIATTVYDGDVLPVDFTPASGGNRTTDGFSTVTVTGLPASTNLKFRITLLNNDVNERWLVDDFKIQGTLAGISTRQNGDWYDTNTWTGFVVPISTDNAIINHAVTAFANVTRDTGTDTTISTTGSLIIDNATYTTNGLTYVNGIFQINTGGFATGLNNFDYSSTGVLNFNTTGASSYSVSNGDRFWPSAAVLRPQTVNVLQGGLIMNNATRVVDVSFTISNGGILGVTLTGTSVMTLVGTCQINTGGFFNNSPIYGNASTLIYNSGGTFGRGFEWAALGVGTIGTTPGYPNNVTLSNNTILDYNNGTTPQAKAINGNLLINLGSHFNMSIGTPASAGNLTIGGNVTDDGIFTFANVASAVIVSGNVSIGGTLSLGTVAGADLKLRGNLSTFGAFTGNGRTVFFTNNAVPQLITGTIAIPYIVFQPASGSTTISMQSNITVSAPASGNAISFNSAADIFDINGNTLTIGTAATANTISGSGTFKGSTTSSLSLLGTGSIGTINFTPTFQNIRTFTINKIAGVVGCVMGTPVTISNGLILTNGLIDLAGTTMTLASTCSNTFTASANSYVIADVSVGGSLRKNVTSSTTYNFPIGSGGTQYSPATVAFAAGTTASAFFGVGVENSKEPSLDANTDYINRYWKITSSGTFTAPTYTFTGTYNSGAFPGTGDVSGTNTNCKSNQWNGTSWLNGGGFVNATTVSYAGLTTLPTVNHITKGFRNPEINVQQATTTYLDDSTYTFVTTGTGATTDVQFTIYNLGEQSLALTLATITGNPRFTLLTNYATPILGPLGTTTFTIRFAPTAIGTFTGSISIPTNDPTGGENPYVINFSGTGATPAAEIEIRGAGILIAPGNTPFGLDNTLFLAENVGTPVVGTKTFTINSLGNIPLLLSGASPFVTLGGANPSDFSIVTIPSSSINPSTSTTFSIEFTPQDGGIRTATVTVGSNDTSEPTYTFNIQGTGNAPEIEVYGNGVSIPDGSSPAIASNSTFFGNINVTAGTAVKIFTIFNTGTLNLTTTPVTITGANAADFTITTVPATSLNANVSTTLVITFNPTATGLRNALVTITNNDITENPYTFDIQGNGIDYITCGLGAFEIIAIQDFEVTPATPTMGYTSSQEAGAGIITVGGGTAFGANLVTPVAKFIGASSFQIAGHLLNSGTEKTTTIEFATVDASAFEEVGINFRLGAYTTVSTQGLDGGSENVKVFVSTNNGATWSEEVIIRGNNQSIWSVNTSTGSATVNYDGNNITTLFASTSGSINTGARNITINNLPNSSQLKIRIIFSLDRLDEVWVIDEVKLQGKKPAVSRWISPGVWSPSAPTASIKSIFEYPYNTNPNGNVSTCKCEINAGVNVTVSGTGNPYIDIEDNFINNGNITIENNGSLIQHNNSASNSGNIIMKRNATMKRSDYVYWSSPVNSFAAAAISINSPTNLIYKWNPIISNTNHATAQGNWVSGNETMVMGKGYIIRGPTTFNNVATNQVLTATFSGTPYNGIIQPSIERGNRTIADGNVLGINNVTITPRDDNWNLIGNPYPSSINAIDFLSTNTNIEGFIRLWTHGTLPNAVASDPFYGNYVYNYTTNDYIIYNVSGTQSGPSAFNGYIAAGQSFFVAMVDGAADSSQTVTFTNALRNRTYNNAYFYRTNNTLTQVQEEIEKNRIWLDLIAPDSSYVRTLVGYIEGATLEKDRLFDAYTKAGTAQNFYSIINDEVVGIQGRPVPFDTDDKVPLGINITASETHTIAIGAVDGLFEDVNQAIFLEDKVLNLIHNLRQAPYSFTATAGRYDDRFVLRYTSDTALNTDDFESLNNTVTVVTTNQEIEVKSSSENIQDITIYDILGRQVFVKKDINSIAFSINDVVFNQQALIVKITLENGQIVTKKIVF